MAAAGILPAAVGQGEAVEPVFERHAGDGGGERARVGEIRQALLARRVVLAEGDLPLRPVRAVPGPDPPLQGAAQPAPVAVRMAALHLLKKGATGRRPGRFSSSGTMSLSQTPPSGSETCRRCLGRVDRGEGSCESRSIRRPVRLLIPALAAARRWAVDAGTPYRFSPVGL